MSGNAQKTPLQRSFNAIAERRALDAVKLLGRALPCSVSAIPVAGVPIVTVKFEVQTTITLPKVTVPIFGFEYTRYPVQVGCKGVVFPADAYLGGVSGLGGGTADLSTPANLSALVFFPVGNKSWDPSEDPNAVVTYGPNGVVLRDTGKKSLFTLTPNGITIQLETILKELLLSRGKLHVIDDALVEGNAAVGGTLMAGATTVDGTVHVTDTATLDGEADVVGPIVLASGATIRRMLTGSLAWAGIVIGSFGSFAFTISVPGAKVGDMVFLGHDAQPNASISYTPWVSAADVVTVGGGNTSSASATVLAHTVRAFVMGTAP